MASIVPNMPTTPSYFPEYGIASVREPVETETGASSVLEPVLQKTKWRFGLSTCITSRREWTMDYYKRIFQSD